MKTKNIVRFLFLFFVVFLSVLIINETNFNIHKDNYRKKSEFYQVVEKYEINGYWCSNDNLDKGWKRRTTNI